MESDYNMVETKKTATKLSEMKKTKCEKIQNPKRSTIRLKTKRSENKAIRIREDPRTQ